MKPKQLSKYLNQCKGQQVLVIGDAILDVNIYCKVRGISAETPTMVLEPLEIKQSIGGAGCVYRNLKALGAMPLPLMQEVGERPIKTRFWVDNTKMLAVDSFPKNIRHVTIEDIERDYRKHDVVVVADYRHGWICEHAARFIAQLYPMPLFVASQASQQSSNHHWYDQEGVVLVQNVKESALYSPRNADKIITYGGIGASYYPKNNKYVFTKEVNAIPVTPIDTSGAGDAFLAAYALTQSLEFANLWAGLSVLERGANPTTIEKARAWVEEHQ